MEDATKTLQIIPAPPGWRVRYMVAGNSVFTPIACWALREKSDGSQEVVGMAAGNGIFPAESRAGFAGYDYLPE